MNQFTVTAPVAGFTGESCGVVFKDGVGHVDDATKEGRAAIEYFRRRGYTLTAEGADDGESEPEPTEPQKTEGPETKFDPAEHNADEVIAYLDSLDADTEDGKAELERVVAAEKDGKNRKTIIEKGAAA